MSYGITLAGFVTKPLQVIKAEREEEYRARLGASIDTSPESVLGQIIGIESEREEALWDLALAIWNARNPAGITASSVSFQPVNVRAVEYGSSAAKREACVVSSSRWRRQLLST